jgi:hypothetical protein
VQIFNLMVMKMAADSLLWEILTLQWEKFLTYQW